MKQNHTIHPFHARIAQGLPKSINTSYIHDLHVLDHANLRFQPNEHMPCCYYSSPLIINVSLKTEWINACMKRSIIDCKQWNEYPSCIVSIKKDAAQDHFFFISRSTNERIRPSTLFRLVWLRIRLNSKPTFAIQYHWSAKDCSRSLNVTISRLQCHSLFSALWSDIKHGICGHIFHDLFDCDFHPQQPTFNSLLLMCERPQKEGTASVTRCQHHIILQYIHSLHCIATRSPMMMHVRCVRLLLLWRNAVTMEKIL